MSHEESTERERTLAKHANPLHEATEIDVELPRLQIDAERVAGQAATKRHIVDQDVCRIGSHASNDLVLDDPTISRFHCRISRDGGAWRITDTESKNGTRLDGVKILAAVLEAEAVITLGDSILRVQPASRAYLKVAVPASFGAIVGRSLAMQQMFGVLERVAASDIDVLITGESGTGKELVATELIQRSTRSEGPVVIVDCGSISPALVESELFGHVRGAFTGADRDREGAFEAAHGGTLFLDEIGEAPLALQPKLLRALEAREVRRVGETRARRVDVRILCATNRDLEREVNRGRFREDLYYRLAKVTVRVPPLRDRPDDIPRLAETFVTSLGQAHAEGSPRSGGEVSARLFTPAVLAEMRRYDWPGNVRELRNYVERSIVLEGAPPPASRTSGAMPPVAGPRADEGEEALADVPFRVAKEAAVAAFERMYIGPLLERCNGNVSRAARAARMDRMYLRQLAQKYGLRTARKD